MDFTKYCDVLIEREKTRQAELQLLNDMIKNKLVSNEPLVAASHLPTTIVENIQPDTNIHLPTTIVENIQPDTNIHLPTLNEPIYFTHSDEIFASVDMKGSTLITNDTDMFQFLMKSLPFFQAISLSNCNAIKMQRISDYRTAHTFDPRRILIATNDDTLLDKIITETIKLFHQRIFTISYAPLTKPLQNTKKPCKFSKLTSDYNPAAFVNAESQL